MNGQGSLFSIIYQGGWLSILVLLVLLIMSVISWAVIFRKWIFLFNLTVRARKFLSNISSTSGIADLTLQSEQHSNAYPSRLFKAAYEMFQELAGPGRGAFEHERRQLLTQQLERCIEKSIISEKATMEKELGLLATISSSAPFIGLLGTVTGIIDAFYSIAAQGASSIAVVAPGISAALVATAVGLFTAIPALVGYNIFREKARAISNAMNGFGLDLLAILDRASYEKIEEESDLFPGSKHVPRKN